MNSVSAIASSAFDRDEQRRRRVTEILRVAADTFNKKGFGGTSLDDVAADLKISKPSLYYYFENKQKLLFAVYMRAFEFIHSATEKAEAYEGTGLERLIAFMTYQIEVILDPDLGPVAVLSETHSLAEEDRATIKRLSRRQDDRIRALISEGMADGSIRPEDAARVEFLIMGMLNWIPKWYRIGGKWSAQDISRSVADLLVHGLAGAPPTSPPATP